MIGRMSPTTTSAAMTQNRGWWTRVCRPDSRVMAQAKTASPAAVTVVMWIHSGEPTRGPMSLVSFGSFMGRPHRCNRLGLQVLPHSVEAYGQNRTSRSQLHTIRYNMSDRSHPVTLLLLTRGSPACALCSLPVRPGSEPQPPGSREPAASCAAAGPWSSSTPSPASSSTGTPSATALSYFDPALSPATRKSVFFDTDPVTFPPRLVIASAASSRVIPSSVPVMTTVTPASGPAPEGSPSAGTTAGATHPRCTSCTPAARHFSTIASCQSTVNQSRTDAAIVGPTSSTATSCSGDAPLIASIEPNARASARAAVGPTCLIDSATRLRQSGLLRASSRLCSSFAALTVSVPCLLTKNGQVADRKSTRLNSSHVEI